jgi:MOSC domain-containing protein YiiM
MRVMSVNISAGRTVSYGGEDVETGIFKESVDGPVRIHRLGVEGDRVADLSVHGGEWKAVYAYAWEHYEWWAGQLPHADLKPGAFGENLTISGLDEEDVAVGDVLRVGTALLVAVQPRQPCFKLGLKFDDLRMVKRFLNSERWGIYFRVAEEGVVERGDSVEPVSRVVPRLAVPALMRLWLDPDRRAAETRRALALPDLPPRWREILKEKLGD